MKYISPGIARTPYDAKRKRYRYPRWNFDGWELRVIERLDEATGRWLDVCEVFYDTKGVPRAWSTAIEVVGESATEIRPPMRCSAMRIHE